MALSENLIDKRVLRRSLEKGLVDRAEFENHLASLPDLTSEVDDGSEEGGVAEASPSPFSQGMQP